VAEERSFLNDGGVYVSNTRIIIHGTTYATANVTSIRKHIVPANRGCALVLAVFSALGVVSVLPFAFERNGLDVAWMPFFFCAILLIVAILWFRSQTPTYRLMLATAGGERQGLTSKDEAVVDRVTEAIADAIIHRG